MISLKIIHMSFMNIFSNTYKWAYIHKQRNIQTHMNCLLYSFSVIVIAIGTLEWQWHSTENTLRTLCTMGTKEKIRFLNKQSVGLFSFGTRRFLTYN